jgi:16S rRNA (cytidine1402-2'-O)-methyltransferase
MSGTLFVVATPIGNLEDITIRALRVLRSVPLVAAEDTRHTAKLLIHHGISVKTISLHAHNVRTRLPLILQRLKAGDDVAVVTDAGTPGVSDPGVEVVAAAVAAGIRVDPVPGPSAVLAALVGSGFEMESVVLLGFPPHKGNARKTWVESAANRRETTVLFESPHRILSLLTALQVTSAVRPIVVARELTKVHQEFLRGTPEEILGRLKDPRGEFTVVLSPLPHVAPVTEAASDVQLRAEFSQLTNKCGFDRRAAVVELARRHGARRRDIYARLERAKDCGD